MIVEISSQSPAASNPLDPAPGMDGLLEGLAPWRERLLGHPIYARVETLEALRVFSQSHVFAVWDFMSLLKSLQRCLTRVELPWTPPADPELARLVNEIVLGEECDQVAGGVMSHYELYLEAMQELGASTEPSHRFLEALSGGVPVGEALELAGAPRSARNFVLSTFTWIDSLDPVALAASFTFGREDVIPDMFERLVETLGARDPSRVARLREYLDRHIELDSGEHGPLALKMVERLAERSPGGWARALEAARASIQARITLWDEILCELEEAEAKD